MGLAENLSNSFSCSPSSALIFSPEEVLEGTGVQLVVDLQTHTCTHKANKSHWVWAWSLSVGVVS